MGENVPSVARIVASATSAYPVCAIDEYASIRFTLVCWTVISRLPTTIVSTAIHHSRSAHIDEAAPGAAISSTRASEPTAAALTVTDMNAVVVVGAPSYTSGTHRWNGTAPILNANPTSTSPKPVVSNPEWTYGSAAFRPTSTRPIDPVAP